MKNRLKTYSILLTLAALIFVGCEKKYSTEGLSRLTYYPDFEILGEEEQFVELGGTFTDEGVIATEAGSEIPVVETIAGDIFGNSGAVNTSEPDKYVITYSAENSDGYAGSVQRVVWVAGAGDLSTSIEGLYSSTVVRNGSSGAAYTDMQYIMIKSLGGNEYLISDGIGGYYDIGRAYGAAYRATGLVITANDIPSNDFSFDDGIEVGAFGGVLTVTSMTVDAGSKTINLVTDWDAGYEFDITLTQVSF